ncbi:MAG: homocysteine S-methyltransferase family protein, partial [Lentisphaeria bacterium]|nr:homocysteine S-methyltransferase family protein [Lentisphaeria bacterium]
MRTPILERLREAPLVFDGAMGTMLYSRGVFLNSCFDELNLVRPELVTRIHAEYVAAGAGAIETNTFGANAFRLRGFGLEDRVAAIALAGARLARQVAGETVYVAGSVGPCLQAGQVWREDASDAIRDAFRVQMEALAEGGVDALLLETFAHQEEVLAAASVARGVGLPVFASCVVGEDGSTALGCPAGDILGALDRCDAVDVIGLNCGAGP